MWRVIFDDATEYGTIGHPTYVECGLEGIKTVLSIRYPDLDLETLMSSIQRIEKVRYP